ncbi:MAG: flavodoxin family protein [Bacillota bacterium]|nr:flavodoxin family protein [Bacillota bacterium]
MANETLLVIYSYHHKNTEKIAQAISEVLGAQIRTPQQISSEDISNYGLIGFGSGIYGGKHHKLLLDFADKLPKVTDRNAFLFSTFGAPGIVVNKKFISNNHKELRKKLQAKGYKVIGEFGCAGFNTNSFTKLFGGINKGRPDAEDLRKAEEFARGLG